MNTRNIVMVGIFLVLIVAALELLGRHDSHRNDLSRNLDRAADNIEEGLNDTKRGIKDALD